MIIQVYQVSQHLLHIPLFPVLKTPTSPTLLDGPSLSWTFARQPCLVFLLASYSTIKRSRSLYIGVHAFGILLRTSKFLFHLCILFYLHLHPPAGRSPMPAGMRGVGSICFSVFLGWLGDFCKFPYVSLRVPEADDRRRSLPP